MKIFEVGDVIEFSRGEYDDYCTVGRYEVLKQFMDTDIIPVFEEQRWEGEYELPDYLETLGYIKEVLPTHAWHYRDYGDTLECH